MKKITHFFAKKGQGSPQVSAESEPISNAQPLPPSKRRSVTIVHSDEEEESVDDPSPPAKRTCSPCNTPGSVPSPSTSTENATATGAADDDANAKATSTRNAVGATGFPAAIQDERHVPTRTFSFPKNKGGRACQLDWFNKFEWLHYDSEKDSVFCHTCTNARRLGKSCNTRGDQDTFVEVGFSNWKKGSEKLTIHESSALHRESVDFILQVTKRESVAVHLSGQLKKEQQTARAAMRTVISSIRYLTRSGQALQGSTHDKGNLMDLLQERAIDSPDLTNWLKRRDKWVSHDIQNEIIEIMAHKVQRKLIYDVNKSPFFGLMADGTTDRIGNEQFSVCFRHVDVETLTPRETFMGLYNADDGTAKTLHKTVTDVMVRHILPVSNLRGHTFDGGANMSGRLNGLQKLLCDDQPKSIFVHCSNHSLDLVIQEIAKKCELISNSISLVKDVSKAILESSKRKTIYENVVLEPCPGTVVAENRLAQPAAKRLIALCPTRWCVRAKAMRRFVENYPRVQETLDTMLSDDSCNITDERRATLRGYQGKMNEFSTLLALNIALSICEPAEQLAKALQSVSYTATGAQQSAKALQDLYGSMGEADFDRIWEATEKANIDLNLDLSMPVAPRARRPPRRLGEIGGRAPAAELSPRDNLRRKFISVLDWSKNELKRRFDQPGMNSLAKIESLLLNSSKPEAEDLTSNQLEAALGVHASDFDLDLLSAQFRLVRRVVSPVNTVAEYAEQLAALPKISRQMFDQVERLVILLLTVPATSTSCERSLSALNRLGTFLRLPMTQRRLSHLAMLHVHREETLSLDLNEILDEFASRTAERRNVFGIP